MQLHLLVDSVPGSIATKQLLVYANDNNKIVIEIYIYIYIYIEKKLVALSVHVPKPEQVQPVKTDYDVYLLLSDSLRNKINALNFTQIQIFVHSQQKNM